MGKHRAGGALAILLLVLAAACTHAKPRAQEPTTPASRGAVPSGSRSSSVRPTVVGSSTPTSPASPASSARSAWEPSISNDGRFVAFSSFARRPARCSWTGVTEGYEGKHVYNCSDVYRFDRQTGKTLLASISLSDGPGNGKSTEANISPNGRYVAFASTASNLVRGVGQLSCPADPYPYPCDRVFVRDLARGVTWLASRSSGGAASNGESSGPRVTDRGDVVFASKADNLVAGDTNRCDGTAEGHYGDPRCRDIFLHEAGTRRTTRLSIAEDGSQADNGDPSGFTYEGSHSPSVAADGTVVTFSSDMKNLTPEHRTGVFVLDRVSIDCAGSALADRADSLPTVASSSCSTAER